MAQIAAGHDGLRTVPADDRAESIAYFGKRLIPGNPLEFPTPLRPRAAERREHPIRMINALLEVLDLDAKPTTRERMLGIAANTHHASVPDSGQHSASVRTIMRTGAQDLMLTHVTLPPRLIEDQQG